MNAPTVSSNVKVDSRLLDRDADIDVSVELPGALPRVTTTHVNGSVIRAVPITAQMLMRGEVGVVMNQMRQLWPMMVGRKDSMMMSVFERHGYR